MEFVTQCVDLFVAELPPLLESLRDGVRNESRPKVSHAAHALKGMISNFCDQGPAQTAQRLELIARQGQVADAPRLLAQLEREVEALVVALQRLTAAT